MSSGKSNHKRTIVRKKKRAAKKARNRRMLLPSYSRLPDELRLNIINKVIGEMEEGSKLAKYATVDRAWQEYVEKRTFEQLTLRPADIWLFELTCVGDRRRWLKKVHLDIQIRDTGPTGEVPLFCCDDDDSNLDLYELAADTVFNAFNTLFQVLSTWHMSDRDYLLILEYEIQLKRALSSSLEWATLCTQSSRGLSCNMSALPMVKVLGDIKATSKGWERTRSTWPTIGPDQEYLWAVMFELVSRSSSVLLDAYSVATIYSRMPDATQAEVNACLTRDEPSDYKVRMIEDALNLLQAPSSRVRNVCLRAGDKNALFKYITIGTWSIAQRSALDSLTPTIFRLSQGLTQLTLLHMVDTRKLFGQPNAPSTSTDSDLDTDDVVAKAKPFSPAWPSLRVLKIYGTLPTQPLPDPDIATATPPESLIDIVTAALPHMPHITTLSINVFQDKAISPHTERPSELCNYSPRAYDEDVSLLPDYLIDLQLDPGRATRERYCLGPGNAVLRLSGRGMSSGRRLREWEAAVWRRRATRLKIVQGRFVEQLWRDIRDEGDDNAVNVDERKGNGEGEVILGEEKANHSSELGARWKWLKAEECDDPTEDGEGHANKERRWRYWETMEQAWSDQIR